MFKQQELEVTDLIYTIKNSDKSYKTKISGIQKVLANYINANHLMIKVDFLDRYIELKYGMILKRRQSTLDHQNKPEYRNLVLDPTMDSSAGLNTNDCFLKNDQPIFICEEKVFTYNIDSFSDLKNGHILDEILNNNRYAKLYGKTILDEDMFQYTIEKINVNDYFKTDDLLKMNTMISIVGIAAKVCNDIIDNHFILESEKSEHENLMKEVDAVIKSTDDYITQVNTESIDSYSKMATSMGMMEELSELYPKSFEEITDDIKNSKSINYTTLSWDISYYVDQIFGIDDKIQSKCKQLKFTLGARRLNDFLDEPIVSIDKLPYIRQFLRLVKLLTQKTAYTYNVSDELSKLNIGELHADGTFNKNCKLIEIIDHLLETVMISPEDLDYVVELYKDRSYVVGFAIEHNDEPKPEPATIKLEMYSDFA